MLKYHTKSISTLVFGFSAVAVLLSLQSLAATSLDGHYCISGFDPTLCGGVKYVGDATITKKVKGGQTSYELVQYFPPIATTSCQADEQNFRAVGLVLNNVFSAALVSSTGQAPSINTYDLRSDGSLVGKWTYIDDWRVGQETLTKVPNNFICPTSP